VFKLVKKDNFVKSLALLGLVVGVAFFAFENRGVISQRIGQRATTATGLTPVTKTTDSFGTAIPQPSQANRQAEPITLGLKEPVAIIQQTPTRTVQQPSATPSRIQKRITAAETTPQVLRPEFLTRTEIINPKAFNKRKFGIDPKLARTALKKPEGQRTRAEKLQLANLRAMETFDSSKITNF